MSNQPRSSDTDKRTGGVTIGTIIGGIHNSIIAGRDVIVQVFTGDEVQQRAQRNRCAMLELVKNTWIKGVLEHSLHGAAMIELGLEEQAGAVEHPWDMVVQMPDRPNRVLPSGTKILDVFDEMGSSLLILGEPGSGKTTMLLELARAAIARAGEDATQPIPVVFNLSSWAETRQPLAEWLVEELNTKYHIPKRIARPWIENDGLLLLLDGLDEVKAQYRDACVKTINGFRQEHGLTPMVVCSRVADYEALTTQLKLMRAILLQPLTSQQVDDYLSRAGSELDAVRALLQEDEVLHELTRSPLMLSIMILAYRERPAQELRGFASIEKRRAHLLDMYVDQMFNRTVRTRQDLYPRDRTINWLAWIAQKMAQHNQSQFLIEQLQPSWLSNRFQLWAYALVSRLISGLLVGLSISPLIAVIAWWGGLHFLLGTWGFSDTIAGLITGPIGGVASGLALGYIDMLRFDRSDRTVPPETKVTRRQVAFNFLSVGIVTGLLFGLIGNIVGNYADPVFTVEYLLDKGFGNEEIGKAISESYSGLRIGWTAPGISVGLIGAAVAMLIFGLFFGLRGSRQTRTKDIETVETLTWSWRGLLRGSILGMIGGSVSVLLVVLIFSVIAMITLSALPQPQNPTSVYSSTTTILEMIFGGLVFAFALAWHGFAGAGLFTSAALIGGLAGGLTGTIVETKTFPNQGIRLSARNAAFVGLLFGPSAGLIVLLLLGLRTGAIGGPIVYGSEPTDIWVIIILLACIFGLSSGLLATLRYGGLDIIQHATLRIILLFSGHTPRRYARFLDYATERIFLRKVGSGYIFVHRLLLAHFVSLAPEGEIQGPFRTPHALRKAYELDKSLLRRYRNTRSLVIAKSRSALKWLALAVAGILALALTLLVVVVLAVSILVTTYPVWSRIEEKLRPVQTLQTPNEEAGQIPTQKVWVALQPIPRGGEFVEGTLGLRDWPTSNVPPGIIGDRLETVGHVAARDIVQGEPILRSMLADLASLEPPAPVTVNGVVYFVNHDRYLLAVDVQTGQELWRFLTKGLISAPAIADGVVYFSAGSTLYAVDAKTGWEMWHFKSPGMVTSDLAPPVPVDGVICFWRTDGNLYAVDARTHAEKWRIGTGSPVSIPIIVDGLISFVNRDGYLYVLDIETGQEKRRYHLESFGTAQSSGISPPPRSPPEGVATPGRAQKVWVAAEPIPRGREFGLAKLALVMWPEDSVPRDIISDLGETIGSVANRDIASGEPIVRSLFIALGTWNRLQPLSSALVTTEGVVYFGSNSSTLYAVDITTVNPRAASNPQPVTGLSGEALPNWEEQGRTNILLLGVDKRPDERYARTDAMILLGIDQATGKADMLSIPPDLWVTIPGYGEHHISEAYYLGDKNGYPGGGPALTKKAVQYSLGVPVHFYVRVDFDGFRRIVDTLGGIDIDVPYAIVDPKYPDDNYGYALFRIQAGLQHLDGDTALKYARTRTTTGAEFDRARRQQQILLGIREKALAIDVVPKIPELWKTMSSTVQTDLQLADVLELVKPGGDVATAQVLPTQRELWCFEAAGPITTPTVVSDTIYFSGGSILYALEARTGQEKWRLPMQGSLTSVPVIIDGAMYFVDSQGYAHSVDAQTGEYRWQSRINVELASAPTVSDGTLYFAGSDYFYAVDVEDGQTKWRIER